ncbi:MerR family transcriptional regulator [Saccharopolyspora sp. CA-218241]|uniref:MerR family transcriptional regulator n=1 Tax=Saccharopolyspora sp. CA-218241 TaxID=3240027 RepID=UPI003D96E6BF
MAWSTRRLAQLGGTTVKTVRHYHQIGLLDEPERAGNGYKQYGTAHLVRVLQIARLRHLGMGLAQIAELEHSDEAFAETLHQLDAQLAESISHQQQLRAEIAKLTLHRTTLDTPAGFAEVADDLTPADRAMIMISSQLFHAQGVRDMREIVADRQGADKEFDVLPANAGPDEIRDVAARLVPLLEAIYAEHPGLRTPPLSARTGDSLRDLNRAVTELYNPAQVEALRQSYLPARHPASTDEE